MNRRVLANLAKEAGFSLYSEEIWHFDKNNQWDSKTKCSLYGSCDLSGIIPDKNNNLTNYFLAKAKEVK